MQYFPWSKYSVYTLHEIIISSLTTCYICDWAWEICCVSTNYTKLYFANIFSCDYSILFLHAAVESPLNSALVVYKHFVVLV